MQKQHWKAPCFLTVRGNLDYNGMKWDNKCNGNNDNYDDGGDDDNGQKLMMCTQIRTTLWQMELISHDKESFRNNAFLSCKIPSAIVKSAPAESVKHMLKQLTVVWTST